MSEPLRSLPHQDPAAERRTRVVLPPRHPPVARLQTPAMTQLSREVRRCPGLRYELIVQAQEGPDISAFERVLATAYGAALAFGVTLNTPELLHWADRALDFRTQAVLDATWDSTEYTPLSARHPVWEDAALGSGQMYAINDPHWGHLATGYLLAQGFPRSPKVQREIRQARTRHLERSGRQFFQLPLLCPAHQSRLLPPLEPEQTVLAYTVCAPEHLAGDPRLGPATWVLALYRPGPDRSPLVGLYAWPLVGPAYQSGQGEALQALLARMDPGEADVRVYGVLGVRVDQQAVRRLVDCVALTGITIS